MAVPIAGSVQEEALALFLQSNHAPDVNPLAQGILRGDIRENESVTVDFQEGRFTFSPTAIAV